MEPLRLQKYLADRGVASRRKCEEYIAAGLIKVNGKVVTEMGTKVDPSKDTVEVDPSIAETQEQELTYIMLYKPVGYICSVTGPEEPKIMELVKDVEQRIFPVGRLDKDSSGLLLMTNDGRFAYKLTHPKFEKEKEYEVAVSDDIPEGALDKLRDGLSIMGQKTRPADIKRIAPNKFRITIREGKNRQIRRMVQKVGLHVMALKRIRIGGVWLRKLKPGEWKPLKPEDVEKLMVD
jgi:23S rRNA pseudouridine2605 synthase